MIWADNLTKVFFDARRGEVPAVAGLTLECAAGQIFGLLGPNGAGKTTTLRMLSGVLAPTSGDIRVRGFDPVTHPQEVKRRIGFLSADTGNYARLTPRETLHYFGQLFQMPPDHLRERTALMLETFEMKSFADTPVAKLSTGMKQKLSLARTLLHNPPVLILDEPTRGLDPLVARVFFGLARRLRDEGKCILMSTHILSDAELLCEQIGIIANGRLQIQGSPPELRSQSPDGTLSTLFARVVEG